MAIIRSARTLPVENSIEQSFDESKVPFVPAWDLVNLDTSVLTSEEAAAVALALCILTPDRSAVPASAWQLRARMDSLSRRL